MTDNSAAVLYFGCRHDQPGRFTYSTNQRRLCFNHWLGKMNGALPPQNIRELQGKVAMHFIHGHTVLAYWDRSTDKRSGSSAAFAIPGQLSFEEALLKAKQAFPDVFGRLEFELTLAQETDAK